MVFTMVFWMHLMCNCRTRTGTVPYSNPEYHIIVNALNFKPHYFISHMLLFRLCFYCFYFNRRSSFKNCTVEICTRFWQSCFFDKNDNFAASLNIKFLSCRVVGIYAACCALSNNTPFAVGVNFGHQQREKLM